MALNSSVALRLLAAASLALATPGCNRMLGSKQEKLNKDGDVKSAEGDYARAINLYEMALDGTAKSADVHYKLALLYDDKMNDPLHALHHFKRYLTLAPAGKYASDVKNFIKRDEVSLITTLSGDAVVPRTEAARLRNENLSLRKDLEEQIAKSRGIAAAEKVAARDGAARKSPTPTKKAASVKRTYVIKSGDTLASISRRFYKSSARWKDILDANRNTIDDPEKLKVGESLVIP